MRGRLLTFCLAAALTGPVLSAPGLLAPRATAAALPDATLPGAAMPAQTGAALLLDSSTEEIAPGVVLQRRRSVDPLGFLDSAVLRLRPDGPTRARLLQDTLSNPRTPADLAGRSGAVAAVNGDFFDIDRTGAPDGPVAVGGVLKAEDWPQVAVGFPGVGPGTVADVLLQGSVTAAGRTWPLASLNPGAVRPGSLALYTPAWGPGNRALAATKIAAGPATEVEVVGGRVSAVRTGATALPVPEGGSVLVATGAAAADLAALPVGTPVHIDHSLRTGALPTGPGSFALGARLVLLRGGALAPVDTADPTWAALRARSAVGWTASGEVLLLTVDGGTPASRGATAVETARLLQEAGAVEAVMLDGGGSAQMVARRPGDAGVSPVGVPSDGAQRPVANAIGLVPAPGGGVPHRFTVGAAAELRTFAGMSRTVTATALDDSGAPVPAPPVPPAGWTVEDPAVAANGPAQPQPAPATVVRGLRPGTTTLRVGAGAVTGSAPLTVLGPLYRLGLRPAASAAGDETVDLPGAGAAVDVVVVGRDAEGAAAAVEPSDVRVEADPGVLQITALPGGFRLTASTGGPVVVPVTLSAGGRTARVPVAVGRQVVGLDPLTDPARWSATAVRGTATTTGVDVPDLPGVPRALRLAYDFRNQAVGTSTASAVAAAPLRAPRGSRGLALWVRGDGSGAWLRAAIRVRGAAAPFTFAARVDWTGWRRVEGELPPGADDVTVDRLYLVQTDAARRGAGAVEFALLDALAVPGAVPAADGGPLDPAAMPVSATSATAPGEAVAVVPGTRLRAADGESSPAAEALVRALREATGAGARHVLLLGSVVGPAATEADVTFARSLIERTLPPGLPWSWLPGDGEVGSSAAAGLAAGAAPAPHRRVDVGGTRYLLLDSAGGSLRTADYAQLPWLQAELAAAGRDPGVRGVVVLAERGTSGAAGGLADPGERRLLEDWLARHRAATGQRVALVSADGAAVGRREGVVHVGVRPQGWASWTLLHLRPQRAAPPPTGTRALLLAATGGDDGWLRAEARPLLRKLHLTGPAALAPGGSAPLSLTGVDLAGRPVELAVPPGARFSGEGVSVDTGRRRAPRAGAVVGLDAPTLTLRGLEPGTATVRVRAGTLEAGTEVVVR
ncbi:uncharacterized protein DUF2233 [Kineococcus xinjiangensis]|uniref:Uncharacterized protein DUF2233 n=1 Tax=Kineococcus xinjiangensis TaxID=512762 RepID=A0A2S6IDI5_9ACTN|nr:phosphodiester glycosidase family protein [Kineococcus xinjiangensis]PPK92282.1 uncharacterized protein DUF2233 [Kineococcus xinjiangensis]